MAGWTPACRWWQCACSWGTMGSPACRHTRTDCGTVWAVLPWQFSSQNVFNCFVATAGTGTTKGFICLKHWFPLTVHTLLTTSSASHSQQQTVLSCQWGQCGQIGNVWVCNPSLFRKDFYNIIWSHLLYMTMGYIFASYSMSWYGLILKFLLFTECFDSNRLDGMEVSLLFHYEACISQLDKSVMLSLLSGPFPGYTEPEAGTSVEWQSWHTCCVCRR